MILVLLGSLLFLGGIVGWVCIDDLSRRVSTLSKQLAEIDERTKPPAAPRPKPLPKPKRRAFACLSIVPHQHNTDTKRVEIVTFQRGEARVQVLRECYELERIGGHPTWYRWPSMDCLRSADEGIYEVEYQRFLRRQKYVESRSAVDRLADLARTVARCDASAVTS